LARAIVNISQQQPLKRSSASLPHEIDVPEFAFIAAVLAPTRSADWRPFAEQESPAVDYLANTAERLGLASATIDFTGSDEQIDRHPTVLLVDPWILDVPGGHQLFRDAVKGLPVWALPLIIADDDAPGADQADQLARWTVAILSDAGSARPERVGNAHEFVTALAGLVREARRQYLRFGQVNPPPGAATRRRRIGDAPDSPPTIAGTANHA